MDERRSARGFPLLGLAAAGTVLGHWLAYLIAIPATSTRAGVLSQSGHGYWLFAVQVGMVLAAIGLALLAVRRLRTRAPQPSSTFAFHRLVLYQASLFVGVEIVERLIVGVPMSQLFGHDVLVLGLLVQVVVAALGARFLRWFERTVDRIAEAFRRHVPRLPRVRIPPLRTHPVRLVPVLAGAAGLRSPPPR
jgi:hypothetical protein